MSELVTRVRFHPQAQESLIMTATTPFQTLVSLILAGDEGRAKVAAEKLAAARGAWTADQFLGMARFVAEYRRAGER